MRNLKSQTIKYYENRGWKFYEEIDSFKKESIVTIPTWSTDQSKEYDSISLGNAINTYITTCIDARKLKINLLNSLHRNDGRDYDNEMDILIDDMVEKLGEEIEKLELWMK